MLHTSPAAIQCLEAPSPPPARILPYGLARFESSCSVYGRECLLELFRQRAGNDADLCDLAGKAPPPAGANGDGVAHLEALPARDRKPRHNETMLADDLDYWLARTHQRTGG